MKYAVHIRSMHTGIHNLIITEGIKNARILFQSLKEGDDSILYQDSLYLDMVEINYRNISDKMTIKYYINNGGNVSPVIDKVKLFNDCAVDAYI